MKIRDCSYKEMDRIGRSSKFQDTNFCGVIAVAKACRVSFGKARAKMMAKKYVFLARPHRKGSPFKSMLWATKELGYKMEVVGVNNKYAKWDEVTKETGMFFKAPLIKFPSTLKIAEQYPHGVYMVLINRHIFTMVNGVIHDWMQKVIDNNRRGAKSHVEMVYKVTKI